MWSLPHESGTRIILSQTEEAIEGEAAKMKPITGQYECVHSSGVGLDYFTSRLDRVTLQPNGRFILTIQNQSRAANAAQSLIKGQQVSATAPETRREGNYTYQIQESSLTLQFDDGGFEQGRIEPNGTGLHIGPNFFNKVSDSTLLPPTHRLQKDMDDIAKGLKIAGTIGGMAIKAAKTIQGTIQVVQGTQPQQGPNSRPSTTNVPYQTMPSQPTSTQPAQAQQPIYTQQSATNSQTPSDPTQSAPAAHNPTEALFCDQCGARIRPGKRFCNNCGARLA